MTIAYLLFVFHVICFWILPWQITNKSPFGRICLELFQPPWANPSYSLQDFFHLNSTNITQQFLSELEVTQELKGRKILKFKQNRLGTCWSYLVLMIPHASLPLFQRDGWMWLEEEMSLKGVRPICRSFHSLAFGSYPERLSESFGWFRFRKGSPKMKGSVILRAPDSNPKPPNAPNPTTKPVGKLFRFPNLVPRVGFVGPF